MINITTQYGKYFKQLVDPDNPIEGTENKTSFKSKLPEHNIEFIQVSKQKKLPQNLCFTK